jgi:hypothetical protein
MIKGIAPYLGKKIEEVDLEEELGLVFTMEGGTRFCISDAGQTCCEARYMTTDDDLESFRGDLLLGVEIKPSTEEVDTGCPNDYHDIEFLEVQTDKCSFTVATHDEHNGFYGGFLVEVSPLDTVEDRTVMKCNWARCKPADEGYYWYEYDIYDRDRSPVVLQIIQEVSGELKVSIDDALYDLVEFDGYWYGPIAPPELPPLHVK